MTRPDDATLADAVEEAVQMHRRHIHSGFLTAQDYEASYIEVAAALGVPIDRVRSAYRARVAMAGSG